MDNNDETKTENEEEQYLRSIYEEGIMEQLPAWFYNDVINWLYDPYYPYPYTYTYTYPYTYSNIEMQNYPEEIQGKLYKYFIQYMNFNYIIFDYDTIGELPNYEAQADADIIFKYLCKAITMYLYMLSDIKVISKKHYLTKHGYKMIKEYFANDITIDLEKVNRLSWNRMPFTNIERDISELLELIKEIVPEQDIILMSHFYRHHRSYNHKTYTAFKKMFVTEENNNEQ